MYEAACSMLREVSDTAAPLCCLCSAAASGFVLTLFTSMHALLNSLAALELLHSLSGAHLSC